MQEHSTNASHREKLIEHIFVGELLKHAWQKQEYGLEVAKPEVDNAGYDLILEANGTLRHVQLKSSFTGATTASQKIHLALATKPSGCVIWTYFNPESLILGPFLYFGAEPGHPLPDISQHKIATHTKGDSQGTKAERPNIRVINKGEFTPLETIDQLYHALFGPDRLC